MLSNLTIDDPSPIIHYDGNWVDAFNSIYDKSVSRYRDNSFHCTLVNGSTATIAFRGTAIYIYGAKRPNHGFYRVGVDAEPSIQYDGYKEAQADGADGIFQTLLFSRYGLANGDHNVTLTNIVNRADRPYVDIDFVTITRETDITANTTLTTVDDAGFEYSGDAWALAQNMAGYRNSTAHVTSTQGATATLTFSGSEVFLYGGAGPSYGTFQVQIDDQSGVTFNVTKDESHQGLLLFTASGLGAGSHKLTVTNLQGGRFLDIDYAEYMPHVRSSRGTLAPGVIGGIVAGAAVALALLLLLAWHLLRKRKQGSEKFNWSYGSKSEQTDNPAWHESAVVEPFLGQSGLQPAPGYVPQYSSSRLEIVSPITHTPGSSPIDPASTRKGGILSMATGYSSTGYGSRPELVGQRSWTGSSLPSDSTSSRTYHEVDAGPLPPMYDHVVSSGSGVATLPGRT